MRKQKGPDLEFKKDVAAVRIKIDWWFRLFLLQYEALHCPGETLRQQT